MSGEEGARRDADMSPLSAWTEWYFYRRPEITIFKMKINILESIIYSKKNTDPLLTPVKSNITFKLSEMVRNKSGKKAAPFFLKPTHLWLSFPMRAWK